MRIRTFLLPSEITPSELRGDTAVVLDVLRATTTMTQALLAGAEAILPFREVDDARKTARELGARALLAGERGGVRIDGFDLGNSPGEFTEEIVRDKLICMTTTNGTRAIHACKQADHVLIGALTNRQALVEQLTHCRQVSLVCAGTNHRVTHEDVLGAGAIVDGLAEQGVVDMDDGSRIARCQWQAAMADDHSLPSESTGRISSLQDRLTAQLADSLGGRNLAAIGQSADCAIASAIDSIDRVARYGIESNEIRLP